MRENRRYILTVLTFIIMVSILSSCANVQVPVESILSRVPVNSSIENSAESIAENDSALSDFSENSLSDSSENKSSESSKNTSSESYSTIRESSSTIETSSSSVPTDIQNDSVMSLNIEIADSSRLVYESQNLNLDAKAIGLVRLNITNTSMAKSVKIYFITYDDVKFNSNKSVTVNLLTNTQEKKSYVADLTNCYGYTGKIKAIKVESSVIFDGNLILHSIDFVKGGENKQPFTIGEKVTAAYRKEIISASGSSQCYFPDGLMGVLRQKDGSLNFYGSSPVSGGLKSVIAFNGTYQKPVGDLVFKDGEIENVPTGDGEGLYKYASIGQIWNFQGEECLTVIHVETYYDAQGGYTSNQYYTSALALGYSPDMGKTWKFAGVFGRQMCEGETNNQKYGMGGNMPSHLNGGNPLSRDVGNGTLIIKDGYIYVYMIDMDKNYSQGFSVLRAKTVDAIQAARNSNPDNLTIFSKLYEGKFSQPGYMGKFTGITDNICPPNFSSIIYSSYLKKYIFIRCSSPFFSSNDGDIVMNISADPLNFKGNNYYIDAGTNGQQYPTAIGSGDNPGFITGKNLNLYYIDYTIDSTFLWTKAKLIRREIIFD